METTRQNKISRLIQKELSEIFLLQTKAMNGVLVSVSAVRISPDMSIARVYLSVFPSEKSQEIVNHKVQHEGFLLKRRADAVQPGQSLHGRHALQLFQHIHGAQFGLVKSGLILVCHQQHLIVPVKLLRQAILREAVHACLGVLSGIIRQGDLPREGYQRMDIHIALLLGVLLKSLAVLDGSLPGSGLKTMEWLILMVKN